MSFSLLRSPISSAPVVGRLWQQLWRFVRFTTYAAVGVLVVEATDLAMHRSTPLATVGGAALLTALAVNTIVSRIWGQAFGAIARWSTGQGYGVVWTLAGVAVAVVSYKLLCP